MFEFKFTDIGEGLEEGKIANVLISEGQQVNEGDPAFSVETDKVTTDIPAPTKGVISKILVKNGDNIHVGQILAYIEDGISQVAPSNANVVSPSSSTPSFEQSFTPTVSQTVMPTPSFTPTFTPSTTPIPTPSFTPTFTPNQTAPISNVTTFTPTNVQQPQVASKSDEAASVVGEVKVSNKVLPLFGSQKLI